MNILNVVFSLISGNSPLTKVIRDVQKAMASGKQPSAIIGEKIARQLASLLPDDTKSVVEALDQLIPDSMEQKMGLTPPMKAFIKKSLQKHQESLSPIQS